MQKKMWFVHLAYYILSALIYVGIVYGYVMLFRTPNLGDVILASFILVLLVIPLTVIALAQFSLLKWYVDPLAALEAPLLLYIGLVVQEMSSTKGEFWDSFVSVAESFSADSFIGWLYLIGLFVLGLLASISIARKEGRSISYRLLSKFQI